jgi:hypothetical protein
MTQPESFTLTTFILGLNPYIVIECTDDPEAPAGFDMKINAGQIRSQDELICLLLLAVESLTGVDADLYTQQVDIIRRAAGLEPLSTFFTDEPAKIEIERSTTSYKVPDGPKMLRETLCVAQTRIGNSGLDEGRKDEHIARLGRLIAECDRHRPLGEDGKHDDLHTPTCGCEDLGGDS